jgi:hypothetical protein
LRATERRPLLYLAKDEARKSVLFPEEQVAQTVLAFPDDATNAIEFGDLLPEADKLHMRDWLWKGRTGKLLVIATPYRHGRPYAKQPTDFLPVIEHLERLHQLGFVHGDIRAFNMLLGGSTEAREEPADAAVGTAGDAVSGGLVATRKLLKRTFNNVVEPESRIGNDHNGGFDVNRGSLIDFDLGGKQGVTKYPIGYKQDLPDGHRLGQEGKVIQYRDDWFALGHVIFTCHRFYPPTTLSQGKTQRPVVEKKAIVSGLLDSTETDVIVELKNFLREAEKAGYTIRRRLRFTQSFSSSLENAGYRETAMATRSPSNAK